MRLNKSYRGTLDGVVGIWQDPCPDGVVVEQVFLVLCAESINSTLQNKTTGEKKRLVMIQEESEMENWEEVPEETEVDNG